jgi:uncharacterized membrane protein
MARFERSIEINAPLQACFDQWNQFEQFPRFMSHVKSVTRSGEYFHWVVEGPMGSNIEWDAKMDANVADRVITWHTIGENTVDNRGAVTFAEVSPNVTRVTSAMEYETPAGALGEMFAKIFSNPADMVQQDLESFRDLMENRSMPVGAGMGSASVSPTI